MPGPIGHNGAGEIRSLLKLFWRYDSAVQVSANKYGISQFSAPQVRSLQISPTQPGALQIGASESGSLQVGSLQ